MPFDPHAGSGNPGVKTGISLALVFGILAGILIALALVYGFVFYMRRSRTELEEEESGIEGPVSTIFSVAQEDEFGYEMVFDNPVFDEVAARIADGVFSDNADENWSYLDRTLGPTR
jgi:hypothetical protein